jgi:tRNA modification GTPase
MQYANDQSNICALSTASGVGAIAIIRVSGPEALRIGHQHFSRNLENAKAYSLLVGKWSNGDRLIDEVVVSVFRNPQSFTGEDVIEIACHGSNYIQQQILEGLIQSGCRMAGPGEFTFRAFMNGKMDLSQSEAVADLIAGESAAAHQLALQQMRGGYSSRLKDLRDELIQFASLVELELDFSEEDVEFASRQQLVVLIQKALGHIHGLTESFSLGNSIKEGIPVAITGKPNVGKSTLLNALLNEEKAIVSSIAGTTRDTIEDVLNIEGIRFRFIDTAGLRKTDDEIEQLGIERSIRTASKSAIVLVLADAQNMEAIDDEIKEVIEHFDVRPNHLLALVNKLDLVPTLKLPAAISGIPLIGISARNKENLEVLKAALIKTSGIKNIAAGATIVSNARHYESLVNAAACFQKTLDGIEQQLSGELLAFEIREAIHHLGSITGEITSDDLLSSIFTRFCIGK